MVRSFVLAAAFGIWFLAGTGVTSAQPTLPRRIPDVPGDVALRRTDLGANTPIGLGLHRPPDLLHIDIGNWEPFDPRTDVFAGQWMPNVMMARFFRLDLTFAGLVNPPGPAGEPATFDPYRHGPHPVNGYVELDMDADTDTGGETRTPWARYLGNVGRFGGVPAGPRFIDRVALGMADNLNPFAVAPFVQRSGEEFHLALFGEHVGAVQEIVGNANPIFEPGEIWNLTGKFFHRAHGYAEFSRSPGPLPGEYEPIVVVRFDHQFNTNRTVVSLVYPLTNAGSAAMRDEPEQAMNASPNDQNSVLEALMDLRLSAMGASQAQRLDPEFPIIANWQFINPGQFLRSMDWESNALFGMAYAEPANTSVRFAWTDALPGPLPGDVTADGRVDADDAHAIARYIRENDGNPFVDADRTVNGRVVLFDFALNFSVYDLNYDGAVDDLDKFAVVIHGDMDLDLDVDTDDVDEFVLLLTDPRRFPMPPAGHWLRQRGDFNEDQRFDAADLAGFVQRLLRGG